MSRPSTSTASVAVVGLGAMGSRIAGRLLATGRDVSVWNRTAAKMEPLIPLGATAVPSPAEAARRGEVVLTMVSDARALHEVTVGSAVRSLLVEADGAGWGERDYSAIVARVLGSGRGGSG
jgi:glutamyl-tRNA reductase